MEDLPFGGIGPSGMGNYHGIDGFRTFSHARAVYRQPKLDVAGLAGFKPPYGKATAKTLAEDGTWMIVERSEEHTSELQSLMRISYAVFCLKKKNKNIRENNKQKQDTTQNLNQRTHNTNKPP